MVIKSHETKNKLKNEEHKTNFDMFSGPKGSKSLAYVSQGQVNNLQQLSNRRTITKV